MDEILKNKMLWVVLALTGVMFVAFLGSTAFVNKVTDRVIDQLKQESYMPGLYPDATPNVRNLEAPQERSQVRPQAQPQPEIKPPDNRRWNPGEEASDPTPTNWYQNWEQQRRR